MANSSTPEAAPKVVKIRRFQIGVNVLLQALIFFGIVVMLNYMSFRHFKRWDFSRDQKYALSSQTTNLLKNLKKPVKAVIFFSSAADIAPDLSGLMREYEFASDKKFKTEIVDPYRNLTRAQELQTKYKFGANENILILDVEGKSKFVNASEMADYEMPDQMSMMMGQSQPRLKSFKGEQAITSALMELVEGKTNKIYFVAGHGEPALNADDLKIFAEALKRQNIQVAPLSLLDINSIPEDAKAIVICGPKKDFSEFEIKLLTDYWNKNGRVFVLLNPFAQTPRLATFLVQQGIAPQEDRVLSTGTFLQMDDQGKPQLASGPINDPTFIVLDSHTKITKDLAGMSKKFLGATESLVADSARQALKKINVIPLIQSGKGFWGETEFGDQQVFFDPKKDHMGPLTLAAAVEKGGVEDQRVKVDSARLVVVGNAELLGVGAYRLSEGISIDFTINALNWLLDREDHIGIAPKEKKNVTLSLNEQQLSSIAMTVMVLIPGIVAFFGLLNWWQRRS
jgi:hypothetical protein